MKSLFLFLSVLALCMPAWSVTRGDVNGDGFVDVEDVNAVINIIIKQKSPDEYPGSANIVGEDDIVDVEDLNAIINIIVKGEQPPQGNTTYTVNGVSFTMIYVEGGTFTMGSSQEEYEAYDANYNETPAHQVTLSDFCIGQTEVTQELWLAVMGSNPSRFNGDGSNDPWWGQHEDCGTDLQRPVETVTWDDCHKFITKLNELTGKKFRLPTEAEWEYAARGGNKSHGYKWAGSDWVYDVAWFDGGNPGGNNLVTHAVATRAPNELELYDMSGNVCEWCEDWFGYYSAEAQTNPKGPDGPLSSNRGRVNRGGAYGSQQFFCRVAYRGYASQSSLMATSASFGFRLAQ